MSIESNGNQANMVGGQTLRGNRLRCGLCDYGAETDGAMGAHMHAVHPLPPGVTASTAYMDQVAGFHNYQRLMAEQAKASVAAREARAQGIGVQLADYALGRQSVMGQTQTDAQRLDAAVRLGERSCGEFSARDLNGVSGTSQMVGLDAFLPKPRTFTREEVLTVLRTLRAGGPAGGYADVVRNTYDIAIRTFERME
jgi:hypothetical protein